MRFSPALLLSLMTLGAYPVEPEASEAGT